MSFDKYEVMFEFAQMVEKEKELAKTAAPAKNPNQEDLKTIEEKRVKSPEKSIIEEAHPEPVYIAEARGDGGLVENQIEQQKKLIEMINKMPTGSLVGRYASTALELVKMANRCDDLGQTKAADILTDAASGLFKRAWDDLESEFEEASKDWDPEGSPEWYESLAEMDPLGRKVFLKNHKYKKEGREVDFCQVCGEEGCKKEPEECMKDMGYHVPDACPDCQGSGRKTGPSMMYSMHPHMAPSEEDMEAEFDHGNCPKCQGTGEQWAEDAELPLTQAPINR